MPQKLVNSQLIPFIQNIKLHICLWKICPLSPLHCGKLNHAERGYPSIRIQIQYQTYELVYMKQSPLEFYDGTSSSQHGSMCMSPNELLYSTNSQDRHL